MKQQSGFGRNFKRRYRETAQESLSNSYSEKKKEKESCRKKSGKNDPMDNSSGGPKEGEGNQKKWHCSGHFRGVSREKTICVSPPTSLSEKRVFGKGKNLKEKRGNKRGTTRRFQYLSH